MVKPMKFNVKELEVGQTVVIGQYGLHGGGLCSLRTGVVTGIDSSIRVGDYRFKKSDGWGVKVNADVYDNDRMRILPGTEIAQKFIAAHDAVREARIQAFGSTPLQYGGDRPNNLTDDFPRDAGAQAVEIHAQLALVQDALGAVVALREQYPEFVATVEGK